MCRATSEQNPSGIIFSAPAVAVRSSRLTAIVFAYCTMHKTHRHSPSIYFASPSDHGSSSAGTT